MKKILPVIIILIMSKVYGQNKLYDYTYTNGLKNYAYSNVEKKEYLLNKAGSFPSISPDGKQVVYTAYGNDNKRWVEIMDINTKKTFSLSDVKSNSFGPVWSPDGKFIAYDTMDGGLTNWTIVIVDVNSKKRVVVNQIKNCYSPTWLSDSKYVAFQDMSKLFVIDLAGKVTATYNISDIKTGLPHGEAASSNRFIFTKDKKKIIHDSVVDEPGIDDDGPPESIFIYDIAQKKNLRLTPKGFYANAPVLSDDKILFNYYKVKGRFSSGIYSVDMDGKNLKPLFLNRTWVSARN